MKTYLSILGIFLSVLFGCSSSNENEGVAQNDPEGSDNSNSNSPEWLVPVSEIKDGGPGKDGIPSIDHPIFFESDSEGASYLDNDDLVIGLIKDNEIKAYPHKILDYHEIVNDNIGGFPISINYCPLTGTAFAWKEDFHNSNPTFGVSGLLYNNNLILYDRETDSNWSQLKLECINGTLIGTVPQTLSVVETTWGNWKRMFPETKVLSIITGFNRNYDIYPYGDYKINDDLLFFSVSPTNDALPNKERVYAIIDGVRSKVYRFSNFEDGKIIKEVFNGKTYLIVGNHEVIKAFLISQTYIDLDFEYSFDGSSEFFRDNDGNSWDITGLAISGPRIGQKLQPATAVVSYWFAIAAFYPNPNIFDN